MCNRERHIPRNVPSPSVTVDFCPQHNHLLCYDMKVTVHEYDDDLHVCQYYKCIKSKLAFFLQVSVSLTYTIKCHRTLETHHITMALKKLRPNDYWLRSLTCTNASGPFLDCFQCYPLLLGGSGVLFPGYFFCYTGVGAF